MDPVLSTQYPIHKIGSDGFAWWVGQIESGPTQDPKKSGRYRVRIVGTHLKDCDSTPSDKLPWANVMLPATTPWSDGGVTGASIGLNVGNWVVGFYLDNDKQKPLIMGSIGHTAGATLLENVEEDPSPGESCKEFTTFLDTNRNPYKHEPLPKEEKRDGAAGSTSSTQQTTKPGQAGLIAAAVPGNMPPMYYALFATANANNPTGSKVCVEVANPSCGSENDLEQGLKNIIADMLKANQDSGGQLGTYYVSKFTGELNSYLSTGREYINKAIKLVKSFIARLKGEIVKLLKDAVDKLVETILYTEVLEKDALGNVNTGPVNPDLGIAPFQPIKVKVSRIKPIIDVINDILEEVGCSMEDLTSKIADYITDLLFGFLMDAYREAACLVDTLVSGIINQIISFVESTLASIMGPLQDILSVISSPVDLISGVVAKAFSLLGISCDGPSTSCEKVTKKCTDCSDGTTDDDDWLDKLLDSIEDGALDETQYVCEEAKTQGSTPNTTISFVGGVPAAVSVDTDIIDPTTGDPITETVLTTRLIQYTSEDVTVNEGQQAEFIITRSGDVTVSSSIRVQIIDRSAQQNIDFVKQYEGSVVGFAPGETSKSLVFQTFADAVDEASEIFLIRIESGVLPEGYAVNFPNGRDFICTIEDTNRIPSVPTENLNSRLPYIPPTITQVSDIVFPNPLSPPALNVPRYTISPEKSFYYETETVVFFVQARNVNPGDTFNWQIDVDPEDIEGGQLSGVAVLDENLEATVSFVLAENNDNFRVDPPGTVAQTDQAGNIITDQQGNILYNEEEIITDFDDLNEILTFTIVESGDTRSITIVGENTGDPSYFIRADQTSYNEGDTMCFYITTSNVEDGTELFYTLSGDIDENDIVDGQLSGSFTIQDSRAVICIELAADDIDEESKLITFSIDGTDASENVFLNSDGGPTVPSGIETYSVSTDKLEYMEGEVVRFDITTTNVPDGTVLQWIMYGVNVTASDFVGGRLTGRSVIINNQAIVYASIEEDSEIEGREEVTFLLVGTNGFATFFIVSELEDEDSFTQPLIPVEPCLAKPIAGEVVTNETGAIVSIPIVNKGCPYLEPPKVIITGAGIGASAIPLLDDTGRVSEVRVTRMGGGYKKNTRKDQNLKCVIDSFTMLNPGKGYKEAPKVLIDGRSDIAESIIDDRGFVVSVRVIDRSYEVDGMPKVVIQGGGGSGARFLPSVSCLDSLDNLAASGFAKIGTGRYIDCP